MTNEPLNIGDMVMWYDSVNFTSYDKPCYGVIISIETTNDETYYNVEWFGYKRRLYTEKSLRKIS